MQVALYWYSELMYVCPYVCMCILKCFKYNTHTHIHMQVALYLYRELMYVCPYVCMCILKCFKYNTHTHTHIHVKVALYLYSDLITTVRLIVCIHVQVALYLYSDLITTVPFFRHCSKHFLTDIILRLKPQVYICMYVCM